MASKKSSRQQNNNVPALVVDNTKKADAGQQKENAVLSAAYETSDQTYHSLLRQLLENHKELEKVSKVLGDPNRPNPHELAQFVGQQIASTGAEGILSPGEILNDNDAKNLMTKLWRKELEDKQLILHDTISTLDKKLKKRQDELEAEKEKKKTEALALLLGTAKAKLDGAPLPNAASPSSLTKLKKVGIGGNVSQPEKNSRQAKKPEVSIREQVELKHKLEEFVRRHKDVMQELPGCVVDAKSYFLDGLLHSPVLLAVSFRLFAVLASKAASESSKAAHRDGHKEFGNQIYDVVKKLITKIDLLDLLLIEVFGLKVEDFKGEERKYSAPPGGVHFVRALLEAEGAVEMLEPKFETYEQAKKKLDEEREEQQRKAKEVKRGQRLEDRRQQLEDEVRRRVKVKKGENIELVVRNIIAGITSDDLEAEGFYPKGLAKELIKRHKTINTVSAQTKTLEEEITTVLSSVEGVKNPQHWIEMVLASSSEKDAYEERTAEDIIKRFINGLRDDSCHIEEGLLILDAMVDPKRVEASLGK